MSGTIVLVGKGRDLLPESADLTDVQLQFDPANRAARQAKDRVIDTLQRAAGRQDMIQISSIAMQAKGSRYVDFLIPGLDSRVRPLATPDGAGRGLAPHRP